MTPVYVAAGLIVGGLLLIKLGGLVGRWCR